MNNEKIDYFFNEFDYLIQQGRKPKEALFETAEDYAYVFYCKKEPKETKNNIKEFTDNLKKLSKEIYEQLEKLYPEKEIDNCICANNKEIEEVCNGYEKESNKIIYKDITIGYILNKIQENFKCNLLDIKSIMLLTYYKYIIIFNNNKKFLLVIDKLDSGILLFNYEEIKNDLIYVKNIPLTKIEKIARIICKDHGYNPDKLIDYDYPRIDHQPHSIKQIYKWEEYSDMAKEILNEI